MYGAFLELFVVVVAENSCLLWPGAERGEGEQYSCDKQCANT